MVFERVKSKKVFSGRVFDVTRDQVRLPDGRLMNLDVVVHRGAVTIIPVDAQDQIWFVRQYRHPAGKVLLELPAGVMEEGEMPEVSALREIREEIGMSAVNLKKLGEFFLAPGYSTEFMHVFLATNLVADRLQGDEDEWIDIEKTPIGQVQELVETGQIQDAKSIAALFLISSYFKKSIQA